MSSLKFLIIGFSGTGNTKMAWEEFQRKMENLNHTVCVYEIDRYMTRNMDDLLELMNTADYIGFAFPIYGADLPPIFDSFLNELEKRTHMSKDAFIITTVGYINAFGPFIIKSRLKKMGLELKWHIVVKVFDNTKHRNVDEYKMQKINRHIKSKTDGLIEDILNYRPSLKGIGPWIIGGYFVRKFLSKPLRMHYKTYYVDRSLCLGCMLCVDDCPANAIIYQDGGFIFSENCTTCFRCKNKCPVGAIKENKQ